MNAAKRDWERKNRERNLAQKRKSSNKQYLVNLRPKRIQTMYGITVEDYDALYDGQGGACAICHRPETTTGKNGVARILSVDHDHESGVVRGLLCSHCNIAIGLLDDDADLIHLAAAYLESSNDLDVEVP